MIHLKKHKTFLTSGNRQSVNELPRKQANLNHILKTGFKA